MYKKVLARCLIACMVLTGVIMLDAANVNAAAKSKVYIGHAAHDENGKIKKGKAGDQTRKEVFKTTWSYSSKSGASRRWKYLFRAKDTRTRAKLADAMLKACANDHIGYDQQYPDKYSCYKEAKKVGWKIDKITTDCEAHCASLMSVCINAAGVNITMKLGTPDEYKRIMETGKFDVYTCDEVLKNDDLLLPGDILLSGKHTAMVVSVPQDQKKNESKLDKKAKAAEKAKKEREAREAAEKARKEAEEAARKAAEEAAKKEAEAAEESVDAEKGVSQDAVNPAAQTQAASQEAKPASADTKAATTKATTTKTTAAKTTTSTKTAANTTRAKQDAVAAKCNAIIAAALKKSIPKTTSAKKPKYKAGRKYYVQVPLNIRSKPSTKAAIVKRKKLSKAIQATTLPCDNAILIPGTKITCLKKKGSWMKIPGGWVCVGTGKDVYIR